MNTATKRWRVAFLVGSDAPSKRLAIEAVCRLPCVQAAAILLDTAQRPLSQRFKSLRRNISREGMGYAGQRLLEAVNGVLERLAAGVIPQQEVDELLRKAFPERSFTLSEIAKTFACPLLRVGNLNGAAAAAALRDCAPDLAIVLGTRILKRSTFSIPRVGCLNLHKGKVPEFRGMPPAFWELYEGVDTAGVTVHFVDDGVDTGDIVGARDIPIHRNETEESLRTKLDIEGARLMAQCVEGLNSGTAVRRPQAPAAGLRPRTRPTRAQRQELMRRRPGVVAQPRPLKNILKTAMYLGLYYSGIYAAVRGTRSLLRKSRAAILLYHRVNDFSADPLTTSTRVFAEHLVLFRHRYRVCDSDSLVRQLRARQGMPNSALALHFDDCYRDVSSNAAPLLHAAHLPASAFISSGFIGTHRAFQHDAERYPFEYENLTKAEVRGLPERGVAIAAHTVNHVDLGRVSVEDAPHEVFDCKNQLEEMTGRTMTLFSFPFGKQANIRDDVRNLVRQAGFEALFSAYGGFVTHETDLFDIPRMGVSSAHRPLDLMMEIEGLSIAQWIT